MKNTAEDKAIDYAMQIQYTLPPDISVNVLNSINDQIQAAFAAGFEEATAIAAKKAELAEKLEKAARLMYSKQAYTILIEESEHVEHFFSDLKFALAELDKVEAGEALKC